MVIKENQLFEIMITFKVMAKKPCKILRSDFLSIFTGFLAKTLAVLNSSKN